MKKKVFGRQFSRDINERKALFKELMNELVLHESINTTHEKAKAIRGQIEKLVTKAKRKEENARQFIQPYLSEVAVDKLMKEIAPRFTSRPGGYTRIIKTGRRFSDNAATAIIEWVEKPVVEAVKASGKAAKAKEAIESTKEVETKTEKKPAAKKTAAKKATKKEEK